MPVADGISNTLIGVIRLGRRLFAGWLQGFPPVVWCYRAVLRLITGEVDEVEVRYRGVRLLAPSRDITITPTLLSGEYEATALEAFLRLVPAQGTVLDVGANLGLYSILAGKTAGPGGTVFGFEPMIDNLERARRNVALNQVHAVSLLPFAVGHEEGILTLHRQARDAGTHSAASGSGVAVPVPVVRLDDWVERQALDRVDAVKIDIEGYDGFAVEGALDVLRRFRPSLLIEFIPRLLEACGYSPARLAENLMALGGACLLVDERRGVLRPISGVGELLERTRHGGNLIVTDRLDLLTDLVEERAAPRGRFALCLLVAANR